MPVKTKKLKARYALIPPPRDANKDTYDIDEALGHLKKSCTEVKMDFDETVEAVIRLGIDPRKPEQNVRGTFSLPHGTGKTPRILVFAKGDKHLEAEQAGADFVGARRLKADGPISTWPSPRPI